MMSDSNHNIRFCYLYRDGGNYKQFGYITFSNPENLSIELINSRLKTNLIDGEFFIASKWQIPALQSFPFDEELDHNWHEFEKLQITHEPLTEKISISEFLQSIEI